MAVQNLWQSLTKNVFSNYAGKDIKNINTWIFDRISNFKDKPDEAGEYEFSQLNVIFELITLLAKENKHCKFVNEKAEIEEAGYPYSYERK